MSLATKALALDETLQEVVAQLRRITGVTNLAELDDLLDVNAQNPSNGDILRYNSTSQEWQNVALPLGLHTYSSTEQRVGTWIDGKPVYEKTVTLTTFPNGAILYIAHGALNIDEIIDIKGTAHIKPSIDANNLWTSIPRIQDNNASALMGADVNNTDILLKGRGSNFNNLFDKGYVTIQYTKTTDTV